MVCTLCYNFGVDLLQQSDNINALEMLDLMVGFFKKYGMNQLDKSKNIYKRLFCRAQIYFRNHNYHSAKFAVKDIFRLLPIESIDLEMTLHINIVSSFEIRSSSYDSVASYLECSFDTKWLIYDAEVRCFDTYAVTKSAQGMKLQYLHYLQSQEPPSSLLYDISLRIGNTYRDLDKISEAVGAFELLCTKIEKSSTVLGIHEQLILAHAKAELTLAKYKNSREEVDLNESMQIWRQILKDLPIHCEKSKFKNATEINHKYGTELYWYLCKNY